MKKTCVACGKRIPSVALDCVFCSARQPAESVDEGDYGGSQTEPTLVHLSGGLNDLQKQAEAGKEPSPLVGIPPSEMKAAVAKIDAIDVPKEAPAPANGSANGHAEPAVEPAATIPSQARLTAAIPAVQVQHLPDPEPAPAPAPVEAPIEPEPAREPVREARPVVDARPFSGLARTIMGVGGVVLMALFFLPWHGVSSWQLLESLSGAEFVRQLFYLTGGIVLVASAVLPRPFAFRAAIGTAVAATPVLLGADGLMEGWRGVVAALAVLGLPATHLLRAQAKGSTAARLLVLGAVAAVGVLYLVPEASVVPIVAVFHMIASGEIASAVMGILVLIPLVFAGLSLVGLLGRDLTDVGVLLSVLSLLWAPMVMALRGLLIDDGTQLYVALAILWASATAALSLAQLLSLAARSRTA